jgi:hypothetical protein
MISVGLDGSRTESVLWHPDDPVRLELPRGYEPPGGEHVWETIVAFPLRLYRRVVKGENIRGSFYQSRPKRD